MMCVGKLKLLVVHTAIVEFFVAVQNLIFLYSKFLFRSFNRCCHVIAIIIRVMKFLERNKDNDRVNV